jgi:hypothetical protein
VSVAPDYAQAIAGWRVWLVAEVDGTPRLASVLYHALWPLRRELVGQCLARRRRFRFLSRRSRGEEHTAPSERCACGIYAARELSSALTYLCSGSLRDLREVEGRRVLHRVFGRVALWGRVVECDAGWRGELAYPQRLYLPERTRGGAPVKRLEALALSLADYGVPIEIVDGAGSEQELTDALRSHTAV